MFPITLVNVLGERTQLHSSRVLVVWHIFSSAVNGMVAVTLLSCRIFEGQFHVLLA